MTAMQSPRRIASAASPTLCVPVAQADTMQTLCPMAPVSIAIIPEQLSTRAFAMNVGATVRGPRVVQRDVVVDHQLLAAGARPEDHADLGAVLVGQLEARVGQGLLGRGDAEMHARFAAAGGLGVHPVAGRSKPWTSPASFASYGRRVEIGDGLQAGDPVDEVRPGGVLVVADGADDPEAGDDDAAVVVGSTHVGRFLQELGCQAARAASVAVGRSSRGVARGDDLGVGGDALDEAGQDLAGPDLDEGRDPGGGHPLDGADPVDARGQVLDELGARAVGGRDRAAVGVGEQRGRRVVERRRRRGSRASPSAASAMSGEWAATLTGSTMARFAPSSRAIAAPASIAARSPGHDDLARRVPVGHDERAVRRGRGHQLGKLRVVEADQRGHRAVAALAGRLHQPAALADEPDAVLERQDAGGDERRVLAHRVAGREGRARGRQARRPPIARASPRGSRSRPPAGPAGRSRSGPAARPGRPRRAC